MLNNPNYAMFAKNALGKPGLSLVVALYLS